MNDQTHILAAILALIDAVFLPCRSWTRPLPQNTAAARKQYQNGGCPWRPGTSGDAQRKSTERMLSSISDKGVIHITRRQGLRFPLVKLSDQADWDMRLKCGLPSLEGAWLVGNELLRRSEVIPQWVSEFSLMGDKPDRHEAVAVENMMLPLLVRGYVESGSTVHGEARYALTESGAAWLGDTKKPKPDTAKENPAACRIYDAAIAGELHRLASEKIQDAREIGMLPLPTSNCSTECLTTRYSAAK